ncbi:family 20 glycosylhydrolase [Gelidibacter salicanalis]|uniref:Family 20 glycosylhydrolase n=1 Tax=Gelidibacter salicanalis TaxID=291193 RepID=A0A5C7AGN5_9FLAO|nr:family 20 glycosylhydrolase [Gelidibacter salicanalis]TXE06593.1 family 20 glycosylhydrolase [Gelidibacter salicanalis]
MNKFIIILSIFGFTLGNAIGQNQVTSNLNVMPWPKELSEQPGRFHIDSTMTISITSETHGRVHMAATNFLRRLSMRTGVFLEEGFPLPGKSANIQIAFNKVATLGVETDESYTLEVTDDLVTISSNTDVGAMNGLQTLLQLTQNTADSYYFPGIKITDAPRFVWRGLMIDVARHFQPVGVLKRNLEAMAAVKLNVFHWHLTDDQGFRVESKVYPKLHELASDGLYYTQEQIKDVVAYADALGIRVIPEFDVPGHASAILTAYPELGSKDGYEYAIERYSGVFDPTLNPTKAITYEFLQNLFSEMVPLFPDVYFHIGGDENEGKHWDENQDIQAFKNKHHLKTNHELQTYFNIKVEKILNNLDKKMMGWDEIMTPNMPTTTVIHSWRGANEGLGQGGSLIDAAKKGYQTVLSNGFYIDRLQSVESHYLVDPIGEVTLTDAERRRILGGEATMWSELVTPMTIDSRIWPRTAAIAERFWSQPEITDVANMKKRLQQVSFTLEELGLTHIKNRDVILRSMTNNQDISALITLSKICEPLKVYSRNKDGIEYKTYSSFTLFADACVVDAEDAEPFNKAVDSYISNSNGTTDKNVLMYLNKWATNHEGFKTLSKNPKISPLYEMSENLSEIAGLLSKALEAKTFSKVELETIKKNLDVLNQPIADVEIVIVEALIKLSRFVENRY